MYVHDIKDIECTRDICVYRFNIYIVYPMYILLYITYTPSYTRTLHVYFTIIYYIHMYKAREHEGRGDEGAAGLLHLRGGEH